MPEGPEVASIAKGLHKLLCDSSIDYIAIVGGRFEKLPPKQIEEVVFPLTVQRVYCKGKLIVFELQDGLHRSLTAFSTLGMTGQWVIESSKHSALQFHYISPAGVEGSLYYCDVRRFGTFMFEHDQKAVTKRLNKIAYGFIGECIISFEQFASNIKKHSSKSLLKCLMDQHSLASSIGNYLVAEILYATRLHPEITCGRLTSDQVRELYDGCLRIVTASYEKGGVSIRDYKHVSGAKGEYGPLLAVYGRSVDPIGNPVIKSLGSHGRTIHWVPNLQILP